MKNKFLMHRNYTKFLILIIFIFLLFFAVKEDFAFSKLSQSFEGEKKFNLSKKNKNSNFSLGIFIGDYSLKDKRFKEIYNEKRTIYGLGLFYEKEIKNNYIAEIGASIRFYSSEGYSTATHDYTKFNLYPFSINVRGRKTLTEIFEPFIGLGIDFYSYKEECPALKTTSGTKMGFHLEGGGYFVIPKFDFIKLKGYFKYTMVKAKEGDFEVDLGGAELGLGIFINILSKR